MKIKFYDKRLSYINCQGTSCCPTVIFMLNCQVAWIFQEISPCLGPLIGSGLWIIFISIFHQTMSRLLDTKWPHPLFSAISQHMPCQAKKPQPTIKACIHSTLSSLHYQKEFNPRQLPCAKILSIYLLS